MLNVDYNEWLLAANGKKVVSTVVEVESSSNIHIQDGALSRSEIDIGLLLSLIPNVNGTGCQQDID